MMQWLPEDVSPYGGSIDALFYFIYYITAAAFILVTALMIIFLYQYRRNDSRRAVYTHGHSGLELLWTIIPALVFIGLGLASKSIWEEVKLNVPETDVEIRVTGKQFNWEVLYPGPDGEFETADDYQVDNDIHVPVGKPVRVFLGSKDVIHSLFMPHLRFKQDMLPGRFIEAWFQADKAGTYEAPCAELCGFGHSGMKGMLYVDTPEDYAAWYNERWPPAETNGSASSAEQTTEEVLAGGAVMDAEPMDEPEAEPAATEEEATSATEAAEPMDEPEAEAATSPEDAMSATEGAADRASQEATE